MAGRLPLFFIVTPSYNQARFIDRTIASVFSQKGRMAIVYLVMDGGSDDGTKERLQSWRRFFQRRLKTTDNVKAFAFRSQSDRGQTDAINRGLNVFRQLDRRLKLSTRRPTFFAYLNSDDYFARDALAKAALAFNRFPQRQWLVGEATIINQQEKEIQKLIRYYKFFWRRLLRLFPWLIYILNPIPQPAVFIRWPAVKKNGRFNRRLRYVMDYDYWLRLQKRFGQPIFINDVLAFFRIHRQSKGGSQFGRQFAEQEKVARHHGANSLILLLHQVHNWATTSIYRLIK